MEAGPRLLVSHQDRAQAVEVPLTGEVTIGRASENSLTLPYAGISRRHVAVEPGPEHWWLVDLGSANGTLLGNRLLRGERVALRDGDTFRLGEIDITFDARADVLEDETQRIVLPVLSETNLDLPEAMAPGRDISDIQQLRRDYEKLRVASLLAGRIGRSRNIEELLTDVVRVCKDVLPADAVAIMRPGEGGQPPRPLVADASGVSHTLIQQVARTRTAVQVADAQQDRRFSIARSVQAQEIRSMLAAPVVVSDRVHSVLVLDNRSQARVFTEDDLHLLSGIAVQVGLAIERELASEEREREATTRARLARFLPPGLVEQIRTGELSLERGGALRPVTVLYSDIRGYTAYSEQVGPEETVRTLNAYFERMVDLVFAHGGTLDKFVGDALMATWGVMGSGADDVERAAMCAREMMRSLEELNQERRAEGQAPIRIGIGVNTGEAVVGLIGGTQRLEFTVIGDAVNVAARLMNAAEPDQILVSGAVAARLRRGDRFELDDLGPLVMKGKREPQPVSALRWS